MFFTCILAKNSRFLSFNRSRMLLSTVPFIDKSSVNVYADGRGDTVEQWGLRRSYYLPRHLTEQLPSFPSYEDWRSLYIDSIDVDNLSPVVAQLLSRVPGRDIPWPFDSFAISRATGMPTLSDSLYAIDYQTMIKNSLWSEWSSYNIDTEPSWMQQWAYEYRQDLYCSPSRQRKAFRVWRDKLSGESNIVDAFLVSHVEGLGTTIRERVAIALKRLRLHDAQSEVPYENEDSYQPIYFAKQALQNLSSMICNPAITSRIDAFLTREQPSKLCGGTVKYLTKDTDTFGFISRFEGVRKKKKCMNAVKTVVAPADVQQDITKFVRLNFTPSSDPYPNEPYHIAPIVTAETVEQHTRRRPRYFKPGIVFN